MRNKVNKVNSCKDLIKEMKEWRAYLKKDYARFFNSKNNTTGPLSIKKLKEIKALSSKPPELYQECGNIGCSAKGSTWRRYFEAQAPWTGCYDYAQAHKK